MVTLEQIRNNLQKAIKESGMKKTEIAEKLNIKPPTLSQYLNGRAMPALDTFANLCKFLDLDANEILCINTPYITTNQNKNNQTITVHGGNVEISQNNK